MRNFKAIWLIAGVGLLSGCASESQVVRPDGHYPSYQEFLAVSYARNIDRGPSSSAPGGVKLAYGECASTFVMQHATPDQRATLDSFARGDSLMKADEWKAVAGDVVSRAGPMQYSDLDRLSGTCPDKVAAFKQAFGPGFNGL